MKPKYQNQSGLSLVELLIALALGSLMLLGVSQLLTRSAQFAKHGDERRQVLDLRTTVLENLDCERTFGFSGKIDFSLSCQNYKDDIELKDKSGKNLSDKFPSKEWKLYGRCEDKALIVKVLRKQAKAGKDAATNKDWNEMKVRGHALAEDLFAKSSQLCVHLFDPKLEIKEPLMAGMYKINVYDCGSESNYLHPCNVQHNMDKCLMDYPILAPDDLNLPMRQMCLASRLSSCKANVRCCRYPNPLTKDCSCPKGTVNKQQIYDFDNAGCSNTYYSDSWREWGCGVATIACQVYR